MNTDKHTPGPWRIGDAGTAVFGPPNGNPSPATVAVQLRRANAAHIVRCVNERDALLAERDALLAERDALLAERDDLLAALRDAASTASVLS